MLHCMECGAEIDVDPLRLPTSARCALCAREPSLELPTEASGVTPVIEEADQNTLVGGICGGF